MGWRCLTGRELLAEWLGAHPCPTEPGLINSAIELWRLNCPPLGVWLGTSPDSPWWHSQTGRGGERIGTCQCYLLFQLGIKNKQISKQHFCCWAPFATVSPPPPSESSLLVPGDPNEHFGWVCSIVFSLFTSICRLSPVLPQLAGLGSLERSHMPEQSSGATTEHYALCQSHQHQGHKSPVLS